MLSSLTSSVKTSSIVASRPASQRTVTARALPQFNRRDALLAAMALMPLVAKPAQAGLFDGGAEEEEVRRERRSRFS